MNFESSAQQPAHGKGVAQKDWIDAKADEGMSQHQQPNAARCIQKQPKTKKFMPEIKGKERLLMKILMEYLKPRDADLRARVKQVIKECYERYKGGDVAYKPLTHIMKTRLRATVGETYWKKAHYYLKKRQMQIRRTGEQQQEHGASTGGVPKSTVPSPNARKKLALRQPAKKSPPASKPPLAKKKEFIALNSKVTSSKKREVAKVLPRAVLELDDGANANKKKRMKLQGVEQVKVRVFGVEIILRRTGK